MARTPRLRERKNDWELSRLSYMSPDPNVRGLPQDYPVNDDDSPIAPLMHNAVGGSTIHWSAHFPRFRPSDFGSSPSTASPTTSR